MHRLAALLLALMAATACRSTAPVSYVDGGIRLRDAEPAPFRLAVAPVKFTDHARRRMLGGPEALAFPLDAGELQRLLVADLSALNAASIVTAVNGDDDLAAADAVSADLLLRPRVVDVRLEPAGYAGGAALSTLLWLTTWLGGLWIDDSEYVALLQVEWDLVNPHTEQRITTMSSAADLFAMSYMDRHDFWEWSTLQTLIIPPPWTFDAEADTAAALAARACAEVAGQVTAYLKGDLGGDERELMGRCRVEQPRNGARVPSNVTLSAAITAREAVTDVLVMQDGRAEPLLDLQADQLPGRAQQAIGSVYEVRIPDTALVLHPGPNLVTIEFVVAGRRTSRTLLLHADPEIDS